MVQGWTEDLELQMSWEECSGYAAGLYSKAPGNDPGEWSKERGGFGVKAHYLEGLGNVSPLEVLLAELLAHMNGVPHTMWGQRFETESQIGRATSCRFSILTEP